MGVKYADSSKYMLNELKLRLSTARARAKNRAAMGQLHRQLETPNLTVWAIDGRELALRNTENGQLVGYDFAAARNEQNPFIDAATFDAVLAVQSQANPDSPLSITLLNKDRQPFAKITLTSAAAAEVLDKAAGS